MPTVVLDPGHNAVGQDSGAEGNGLKEQNLTLAICQQIKPLLQYNGITVVMTREGDSVNSQYTSLSDSLATRVRVAEGAKADLFVSVHINAFNGNASGQEVLIYGTGGKAEKAANFLYNQINRISGWPNRGVKVRNELYVLKYTSMPAIMTENGFIDNASDSAKLKDPAFIKRLAVAHAKGICEYFSIPYKEDAQNTVAGAVGMDKTVQAIALLEQAIALLK